MGSWWVGCVVNSTSGNHVAAFNLRDTSNDRLRIFGTTPINDGAWHHIVAVRKSGENLLFVDGALQASQLKTYTGSLSSDGGVTFGTYTTSNIYDFTGTLDEVAIYNKALAPEEIQMHYNAGAGQSYCNDAPVGGDDSAATGVDAPVSIPKTSLLSNDQDPEGASLGISAFDPVSTQGGTIVESGTNLVYTPPAGFTGEDTFTYTITDGTYSDTATVSVAVGNVPDPPQVTNPGDQSHVEGSTISLQIEATDPDGDGLAFEAQNLPSGLGIDIGTGLISGTISYTAAAGSPYTVKVIVTDDSPTHESTEINFSWVVTEGNAPPVIDPEPANQINTEGDTVSFQIVATDPENNPLSFQADGLPAELEIDPAIGLIGGVIGENAFENMPPGGYQVTITVSDDQVPAGVDTAAFTWIVNQSPEPTSLVIYLPLVSRDTVVE
jgi:hypothetical protein